MMFLQGGVVFLVLVALAALVALVFFERLLSLRIGRIDYHDFLKGVCNVLEKGNEEEALMLCDETPGPVARIVDCAVRHRMASPESLRETVDNTAHEELSKQERRLMFLSVGCQIAPLCGLFGAIAAMLRLAWAMRAENALVLTADLSGGVLQALLCVGAGILVAVQCHVMYAILISRIERMALEMETAQSEILAYLTRQDRFLLGPMEGI